MINGDEIIFTLFYAYSRLDMCRGACIPSPCSAPVYKCFVWFCFDPVHLSGLTNVFEPLLTALANLMSPKLL